MLVKIKDQADESDYKPTNLFTGEELTDKDLKADDDGHSDIGSGPQGGIGDAVKSK